MPDTVRLARLDDAGHVVPGQWPPEVQQAVDAAAQVAADKAAAASSASAAAASAAAAGTAATAALNAILPTLAPAGHTHQLESLPGVLPVAKGGTGSTSPAAALTALGAAPASHTHDAGAITTGTLPIGRGGTGATSAASALSSLGAAAASHTHQLNDLGGTLAVSKGGTGATSASAARTALGAAATSHVHSAGDITTGTLAAARLGDVPHDKITAPTRATTFGTSKASWGSGQTSTGYDSFAERQANRAHLRLILRRTSGTIASGDASGGVEDTAIFQITNETFQPRYREAIAFIYYTSTGTTYQGGGTIETDGTIYIRSLAPGADLGPRPAGQPSILISADYPVS